MSPDPQDDFLFRDSLDEIAPFVSDLIRWERERQARKLIFIPSESYAPPSVREALGSRFQNIYAEGYPPTRMTREPEYRLKDVAWQLAYYRRYADRRFYKGVDYVHFVECLAQRRCAQAFAHGSILPEHIHVNVQALSGTAANLGVYWTLLDPGDTLMGLDLYQGGHLSHGSEFNISGQRYQVVSYGVNPETERLDYDRIREQALEHQPKIIVAGYTSYPWAPDWEAFREIADEVDAYLMADVAHVAGMTAAGVYPNPVGIADVTTFTTHKTLCGPRGAVILTTDPDLAKEIDLAIFPGEQGGPHVNKFAAMAVAFKIAQSGKFKKLQEQIVKNAKALAAGLQERGLRLAYGGTDTHLLLIDLKSIEAPAAPPTGQDYPVWGEPAVRMMDLAGLVANKNTIPGDEETSLATGIRLGTPWLTQRGLDEGDMDTIAGLLNRLLTNIRPFTYNGLIGTLPRGKVDISILEEVRQGTAEVAEKAGIDFEYSESGYPHYTGLAEDPDPEPISLRISGWRARQHMNDICTSNMIAMDVGDSMSTYLLDREGRLMDEVIVTRQEQDEVGRDYFILTPSPEQAARVTSWLRGLADGYTLFDEDDLYRKVEGPVVVEKVEAAKDHHPSTQPGTPAETLYKEHPERFDLRKLYFVGRSTLDELAPEADVETWAWEEPEQPLKKTPLNEIHKEMGGNMVPFAGWEMPVRYGSVLEEHRAVRNAAGLFDVSHMGVFEVSGPNATHFLDTVFSNYAAWIEDGQSMYGYFLEPDGSVIDDGIIYRSRVDQYYMVVNASNEGKDWDWLNAVNNGDVLIDEDRPWIGVEASATLRNLKDPAVGEDQKRDIALQGPASLKILQALTTDPEIKAELARLPRTRFIECELVGIPLVIARTGYTGENWGFEILVHPEDMGALWTDILEAGEEYGVKPAGLACRDSTRIEAGLPLYGHELEGPFQITPIEAGFPGYVKYHKPFFVGRKALLEGEKDRDRELIRFRLNQKRARRPHMGDPVVEEHGKEIGQVTSCSIDEEGYMLGLAIVDRRYNDPGTPISIFPLRGESLEDALLRRNRVTLPVEATILTRFPVKGEAQPSWMGAED
ncbi:MAG: glycine cleavage system aminomethyltransferase GcvT [Anaerolineales bacterium]